MDEQLKKNVRDGHTWVRLVYMLLFSFVIYVAMAAYWVLAVVQFLFALLTGRPNRKLVEFADVLCQYISQCLNFVGFTSDDKPFPFADLPASDVVDEAVVDEVVVEEASVDAGASNKDAVSVSEAENSDLGDLEQSADSGKDAEVK
ncbi:DUF4389 domain-containing protein [Agaribacterium sp. ZY112]|uniref:DUF4389 domain-containing protein n=1 Tax=Agaribacterium sp. ZY112 TaxID=3233574 RepID=UPI0035236D51